jgi:hypothetical protein
MAALQQMHHHVRNPRLAGARRVERARVTTGTSSRAETEIRREAYTMAFYVAICLDAALVAAGADGGALVGLIWGTTIGLALAHLFAFRLAARLVGEGEDEALHGRLAAAQLVGAAAVAAIVSVPALVSSGTAGADGARFVTSGLIAIAAFYVGRSHGASRVKSALLAGGTLLVASAVVFVKVVLVGH